MATKTIDQIYSEYRLHFKGLKPSANLDQTDSDLWIRGRVYSAVLSGVYADGEKIGQDAFPQNARREALLRHIFTLFNQNTFFPATVAQGTVDVTGDAAAFLPTGSQFTHAISGNTYTTTEDLTLDVAGEGTVAVESTTTGQTQNLEPGADLLVTSPPSGIDAEALVSADGIRDGTNEEDETRAAARILTRKRSSARGGTRTDYLTWALNASPSVTGASLLPHPLGLGTVGIIITSGTTDIDAALDAGDAISLTPSPLLITTVQEYIDELNPNTDCVFVYAAVEVAVDVTISALFTSGDKDTILSGQTLTQGELLEREVKRAIYKAPIGGVRRSGDANGYLTKKTIEDMVDSKLSANDTVLGTTLQILVNRVVSDLDSPSADYLLAANERPVPGTITITDFVV